MKAKEKRRLERREFFRAAGFGSVAAVAGLAATAAEARESDQPAPSGKGYQETEHVKKYYDLARF